MKRLIPINLGYSKLIDGNEILKQYLLYVGFKNKIIQSKEDYIKKKEIIQKVFIQETKDGNLKKSLLEKSNSKYFENPNFASIMYLAYDYEVLYKYKGININNNEEINLKLIKYFNDLYNIDYDTIINNSLNLKQNKIEIKIKYYNDLNLAVEKFFNFIEQILRKSGNIEQIIHLGNIKNNIDINYSSNCTSSVGFYKKFKILLGNKSYNTLFHELTHCVNYFFLKHSYKKLPKSYKLFTEGLATFFASNICENIINGKKLSMLDKFNIEYNFDDFYLNLYKKIIKNGSKNLEKNKKICEKLLKIYKKNVSENTIHKRIYRFFHFNQNNFLYPKELIYTVGYTKLLKYFENSINHIKLLGDCLLIKNLKNNG